MPADREIVTANYGLALPGAVSEPSLAIALLAAAITKIDTVLATLAPSSTVTPLASTASVQQSSALFAVDTGSANAYAVALSPAPTLVAGSAVLFKAVHANTGASTLAVNGGSAIAIVKAGATPLAGAEISAGQIALVIYDGTSFQLITI